MYHLVVLKSLIQRRTSPSGQFTSVTSSGQLLEQLKRKQIKYLESKGYINENNYVFLAVRRRHDYRVCRLCFHVGRCLC